MTQENNLDKKLKTPLSALDLLGWLKEQKNILQDPSNLMIKTTKEKFESLKTSEYLEKAINYIETSNLLD